MKRHNGERDGPSASRHNARRPATDVAGDLTMMRIAIFAALGLLPTSVLGQATASARPTIPRVIGMTAAAAIDALAITRLQIVQRDSVTSSVPAGHVVDQRPRAGTAVSATRAETLFVATPQKPKRGEN